MRATLECHLLYLFNSVCTPVIAVLFHVYCQAMNAGKPKAGSHIKREPRLRIYMQARFLFFS
jgi:hypothetical protein